MLSIGLMSGTSMDGIDAALLETDGTHHSILELGNISLQYHPNFKILLKAAEYSVRHCCGNLEKAKKEFPILLKDYLSNTLNMHKQLIHITLEQLALYLEKSQSDVISLDEIIHHSTQLHVLAVQKLLNQTHYTSQDIAVVGYHGQALYHQPAKKISIIVGDGQYLANAIGITVINNFRARDVEAGGQGAPFAPLYHQALAIRDKYIPLAVVNCGGIANITLMSNTKEEDLIGFDTGPGNGLIDNLMRARTAGKQDMDKDGQYGLQGSVNQDVLNQLFEKCIIKEGKNYFLMQPPKALDIGDLKLIPELDTLSLEDACATLEAFTALTIVESLESVSMIPPKTWILAGGGWNNPVIYAQLKHYLINKLGEDIKILTADEAGWNGQAMEAQIFAFLAVRSLRNLPISFPGTTKVPYPMSGGETHFPLVL